MKYWKIVTLCIITVIGIGTFYIQSSLAENENTHFEFERISGNEDVLESIFLYTDFVIGNMHQSLQISNKETYNLESISPLQSLIRGNNVPVLKELIEKYRNFMRGKILMPNHFYEDEDLLAYASIRLDDYYETSRNSSFDIEVLNKKSGETTSIQLDIAKQEINSWMDVVEVQAVDGKLKVFTREFRTDGGDKAELSVYTFDIEGQKLINNELILSAPTVENGWSELRIINDFSSIKPEKYLLIKIVAFEDGNVQDEGESVQHPDVDPELVTNEVFVYNMENNQLEKFIVQDDMLGAVDSATIFDSIIFIPSQSVNGLEVSQYDIQNEKWGKMQKFDLSLPESGEDTPFVKLMNGKVYIIRSTSNGHSLFIGDLKTAESLYEGKLKVKNQRTDQQDYRLYINEIEDVQ